MSTQTSTASNVVSLFYFCFLYVNVQYSFIIHLRGSHAVRYDIHHNFSILQTCKVLILFHRSSIGSSIHMFVILLTLIFIFLILFGMTFIFFFHRLSMLWVASNVVSLFYFCFLYVNVQYSFIIHVCRSHAIGYDIHHNLNIFQTCKFLILFHRSSFGSSIYMFFIEALLTFMFVFLQTTIRNVLLISFQWCNK